jgi:polyisoprenoid-binding protein YceI
MAVGLAGLMIGAPTARAQQASGRDTIHLRSGLLTLRGTSNLRAFSCTTASMLAVASMNRHTGFATSPDSPFAVQVLVTIPIKSLDCKPNGINASLFRSLRGEQFPAITYRLGSYDFLALAEASDSMIARTVGTLSVAGKDKLVPMVVSGRRTGDGGVGATGSLTVNMTDFGVVPPTLFLGLIHVRNPITIQFDLIADAPGAALRRSAEHAATRP